MNRIYQGRVSDVRSLNPDAKAAPERRWLPLEGWDGALWEHHRLFQTAVNYYTLCFAALARGMDEAFEARMVDSARNMAARDPRHKTDAAREKAVIEAVDAARAKTRAVRKWRDAVIATWVSSERKGKPLDGGYKEVAPILDVEVVPGIKTEFAFAACASAALAGSNALDQQRAEALMQLLEEADITDLNQLGVGRLPFFCTASGALGAVSRAEVSRQEMARQRIAIEFQAMSDDAAIAAAASLDLGVFLTTPPTEEVVGEEAARTLRKYWEKVSKVYPDLDKAAARLDAIAPRTAQKNVAMDVETISCREPLRIPALGRKPSGIYPVAAVFRYIPCAETLSAFRLATASLCKTKEKVEVKDAIADSRVGGAPHFDYFTNLAFQRDAGAKQRAAWFEFDLAAFVEAVKSPHRYFQGSRRGQI